MKKHYSNIILGLNLLAALIVTVPALIVLISDKGFSPFFSKIIISIAILCIEIGFLIKIFIRRKEGESTEKYLGVIVALLIVIIWGIFK